LCLTGEPALEPPSYYFTKPGDAIASTCQPPPDGAQRFSRRVRGIAAQSDVSNADDASEKLRSDSIEPSSAHPPYRMVTKRIRFRRATLPRSVSPWCRSRRRRYRKVIVYVDENGKELSALDMHKRAKAGTQSAAESDKKTENSAFDKATKKPGVLSSPASETRSKKLTMNTCTAAADKSVAGSSTAEVCNQLNYYREYIKY